MRFPNVIEADLAMQMQYETAFGIYNHNEKRADPKLPWPLLAVSDKESLSAVDPLDFRLDQYAENRVWDIFGISFDQLIQFPRSDFLKVINSAKKHSARLDASGNNTLGRLEKELNKLKVAGK